MIDLARPILGAYENGHFVLGCQLNDLTNEDALRRTRNGAGSSITWIVGHLLSYRCQALVACGLEQADPYAEKFSFQTPASDGGDYPELIQLKKEWVELHGKLTSTLDQLTAEQLLADSPQAMPGDDPSLLGVLAFYAWHEAYHMGAIGILRAEWGLRRTHELVMDSM